MNSVAKAKRKRALLFLPVCMCLISLSIIRMIVGFPKVKFQFQRTTIKRISDLCKRLFSLIRNPFRIRSPWYVPPYYIQEISPEIERANLEKLHQLISKERQTRESMREKIDQTSL